MNFTKNILSSSLPILPLDSFKFLQDLEKNNTTEWFSEQRKRYERDLVKPLRQFISNLAPQLLQLDEELDISYRVNTTVMRINRDRRFIPSADPYRTYVKVSFPRQGCKWSEDPVYGFGIFPSYFYVAFRNAGKSRKVFINRFQENLCRHRDIFSYWLDRCQVSEQLMILGGKHEAIEEVEKPSCHVDDWLQYEGLTVGYIWPIGTQIDFPKKVVDKLVRLYCLRLFAVSNLVESDADHYFELVDTLCN